MPTASHEQIVEELQLAIQLTRPGCPIVIMPMLAQQVLTLLSECVYPTHQSTDESGHDSP